MHIDEGLESGINNNIKKLRLKQDVESLELSIHWVQDMGDATETVHRELRSTRSGAGGRSLEGVDEYYVRLGHDREGRTTATLRAFTNLLRSRELLGPAHLAMPQLTNVLAEPHRVITDSTLAHRILRMKDVSRTNIRLHLLQLFKPEYGGLTQSDLNEHFDGKQPKSRTSRKRRGFSFLEASGDADSVNNRAQKKRKMKSEAFKRMIKRKAIVLNSIKKLCDIGEDELVSPARKASAAIRLRSLREAQLHLCECAQAYRQTLDSHVPFHVQKNMFWTTIQECFGLSNDELSLREGFAAHPLGALVVVRDLMNTVYHSLISFMSEEVKTIRAAMVLRVRTDLRPYLTGARGKDVETVVCSIWTRVLSTQKYCPRGNVNHVANVMTTTVTFRICPILRVGRTSLTVPRVQYCSATAHVVVTKSPLYWRRYALRCKKYSIT